MHLGRSELSCLINNTIQSLNLGALPKNTTCQTLVYFSLKAWLYYNYPHRFSLLFDKLYWDLLTDIQSRMNWGRFWLWQSLTTTSLCILPVNYPVFLSIMRKWQVLILFIVNSGPQFDRVQWYSWTDIQYETRKYFLDGNKSYDTMWTQIFLLISHVYAVL